MSLTWHQTLPGIYQERHWGIQTPKSSLILRGPQSAQKEELSYCPSAKVIHILSDWALGLIPRDWSSKMPVLEASLYN